MLDARAIALSLLNNILEKGAYCHVALKDTLTHYQDLKKQDRAFITRLVEGTIEHRITIDFRINCYSKVKVRKMKPIIRTILRMSVYQLYYMTQIPESAVCNEAVKLAKKKGFQSLSGFVNGVLRSMIREPEKVVFPDEKKETLQSLSIRYSMPEWIVSEFLKQYDRQTVEVMLQAFLSVNPTSIRCNTNQISCKELEQVLQSEGVLVEKGDFLEESYFISHYNYLGELPSFQKGYFQVQDPASMLVGAIADVKESDLVLDVCSAPGGKSLHIACRLSEKLGKEKQSDTYEMLQGLVSEKKYSELKGVVISRDLTKKKVELIEENRVRLRQDNLIPQIHDALVLDQELIGKADVVIADLPCSGLGVIGKKPDIKYRIQPESLHELANLQRQILDVVHQYVKPGGTLIYSTCTISLEENKNNMKYIREQLGFEFECLDPYISKQLQSQTTKEGYLQLLPGVHKCDGFFLSRYKKSR